MKVLKRLSSEKREMTAPVLVPESVDYHGHIYSELEVHKACRNYKDNCDKANIQHLFDVTNKSAEFVEHYVTPAEMTFGEGDDAITVKKGTWLATMRFNNDSIWEDVKDGKFTGFSIHADCMSRRLKKSKIAGGDAAEEGIQVEKRLFDIDFSEEAHHVALVDEAANATKVLVLKSKTPNKEVPMTKEELAAQEVLIKKKVQDEAEAETLKKAKDLEFETLKKAKADQDAELLALRKEKEIRAKEADAQTVEYEALKKEKDDKETAELIVKSKEFKADDADAFGLILKKCKYSLEGTEYETLIKQLDKLKNVAKNKDALENLGEANAEKVTKSYDDEFTALRAKHIAGGMIAKDASFKARQELAAKADNK